ncbi:hypothetical protein [Desulfobulbus alkaliphilus]|uniref:hypothetical protein n=1 Tax=Desulfobulbus alkaliphilus TaxID=869814 RepID=UPI0019634CB9|nr:hypothetical protein [Desulfobulbus alkaliphilus]MBM9537838.1 hypothetical protein [Desulfobulbus alkaliphilus]
MKKVLVAGAALMLAGGIALPAMASEPGVSIFGDSRARIIYTDAYDYNGYANEGRPDLSSRFNMDSRLRFNVKGTAAGGAFVHARIRAIDNQFNGDTRFSDANNLWADVAYLSIPFTDDFTFQAGKYRAFYGTGFFFDDIGVSGLRGIYTSDTFQFMPFLDMVAEGQQSINPTDRVEDNDVLRFGGVVAIQPNPDWEFGFMAAYQTDDRAALAVEDVGVLPAPDRDGFIGMVYTKGTSGNMALQGEFAYVETAGMMDATADDAFGGYIRPSFTMDALTLSFDLGFTQDGYVADAAYGFVMIGGEWATQAMRFGQEGDWIWGAFSSKYQISEDLFVVGNLVYADIDSTTARGLSDAWEVSGLLQYNISPGANLQYRIGYLNPSYDNWNDDSVFGTVARFNISF